MPDELMARLRGYAELVGRLGLCCTDYGGTQMPDGAEPMLVDCSDLLKAATAITALSAERDSLNKRIEELEWLVYNLREDNKILERDIESLHNSYS